MSLKKPKNDRYYLSEIHKHSEKIIKELKRLKGTIGELKSSAQLKDTALNQLNQLESTKNDLEKNLQKCRFMLNIANNRSRWDDISNDIAIKSSENNDLLIRLEDIYVSRKNKERQIDEMKNMLKKENNLIEKNLETLSEHQKQEYYRKKQELNNLKNEITSKKHILNEHNSKVEFYFNKIDYPVKKSLYNLIVEYNAIKDERDTLAKIVRNKGSVKREEEHLLQSIREARVQLQSIELENKSYQEKLESVQEMTEGLEKDLKEGYSARHGKYLELMKREQKMNQFIDSAVEKIETNKKLIDAAENAIVDGLNFWSLHLDELDDTELNMDDVQTANQECQMQLVRLQNLKERIANIRNEIDELRNKKLEIEKELLEQDDPDEIRDQIQSSIENCRAEKEILNKKISATLSAIEEAFKRSKQLSEHLAKNKSYGDIRMLEEKMGDLGKRKDDLMEHIVLLEQSTNNEQLVAETYDLIKHYNKMITNKL